MSTLEWFQFIMNTSDMALQIIFSTTGKIAENAVKGFQIFTNTLEWLQLVMDGSNMHDQTTFPATLVATKAAIKGFQFVMNVADMFHHVVLLCK